MPMSAHESEEAAVDALPPPPDPVMSRDQECCAICFEHRPFVNLPCNCHVSYCASCWDRALATSVTVRGRAQCPSCRTAFEIDYNPDRGGLTFARGQEGTTSGEWRARLYSKAKPVQIKLLYQFGVMNARNDCEEVDKEGSQKEDDEQMTSVVPEGSADSKLQDDNCPDGALPPTAPLCVCGSFLESINSRDRIIRMLDETESTWRSRSELDPEALVDKLLSSSLITCDICEQDATRRDTLWTCQNGTHTLLHPASYDVCEDCFVRYSSTANQSCKARWPFSCNTRCWESCQTYTAAVRSAISACTPEQPVTQIKSALSWRRRSSSNGPSAPRAPAPRRARRLLEALLGEQPV